MLVLTLIKRYRLYTLFLIRFTEQDRAGGGGQASEWSVPELIVESFCRRRRLCIVGLPLTNEC